MYSPNNHYWTQFSAVTASSSHSQGKYSGQWEQQALWLPKMHPGMSTWIQSHAGLCHLPYQSSSQVGWRCGNLQVLNSYWTDLVFMLHTAITALFKKPVKTQIDTKLVHETCAGHISRTTCLIALVSFVTHSPTCTAGPGVLNFHNLYIYPSLASSCLNLRQLEANWGRACVKGF